jgi:uncharacterized protein YybS (DUF2232 family)
MSPHSHSVTPMVEGGILSAVAIILAFISAALPVIGVFSNFIWPVPIIVLGVRHGYRYSIMATIVSGILIATLMGPMQAVMVVIGFGLVGIALGHSFRNSHSPIKTILIGSVASLVSTIMVVVITIVVMGFNPLMINMASYQTAINQTLDFYRTAGYSEDQLAQAAQFMSTMVDMIRILLPASCIFSACAGTVLNYWIAKKMLKRLGYAYPGFPSLDKWCLPKWAVIPFFCGTAVMFFGQSNGSDLVYNIGINIQIIGFVLLLIQGLALIYFFAVKYNLSRFERRLILVLALIGYNVVVIVGAVDAIVDYRRLRAPGLK